ncbi:MAG: hypothetical protein WAW37_13145, partial [Syntrophobacteraceae bacterium]
IEPVVGTENRGCCPKFHDRNRGCKSPRKWLHITKKDYLNKSVGAACSRDERDELCFERWTEEINPRERLVAAMSVPTRRNRG